MASPETLNPSPKPDPAAPPRSRRRRRRWPRILLWTFAGLLMLVVLVATAAVLRLRAAAKAALPQLDGELPLAGLSAPVTVQRDSHGVPHITAATQDDLFAAQGYITAQDRLWQMDLLRRNANGELAEILGFMGDKVVQHDKAQRILGIRRTAQRICKNLDPAERARMNVYASGVNRFIDDHQDSLPPEFTL